jgi:uncharacterized protein YdeI (YjbR/CyaY-like superfamily)
MNRSIEEFMDNSFQWTAELELLRTIISNTGLNEELKWGCPCYTFNNANIAILGGFKNYCALSFFKGALLADTEKILIQQTQNVHAARQLRFTSVSEINKCEQIITSYLFEAIEIEKSGLKIEVEHDNELHITPEFYEKVNSDKEFELAFDMLTPGRKRGYHFYFSDAKNPNTRRARIEKSTARILMGKGLNDCICGWSKKMPSCDGSHKMLKNQ